MGILSGMTLDELSANTEGIIDLLTQISVLFEPNEVRAIRNKIDICLNNMLNRHLEPYRKEYHKVVCSLYQGNSDAKKISKELYARLTFEKRRANKLIQRISDSLHNLVSRRGVSNNHQSIKMRIREATIENNVADALNMTIENRTKFLLENCSNFGILMANVDHVDAEKCLRAVGQSQICLHIDSGAWSHSLAVPDERMGQLDATTVGALIEITVEQKDHPLYGINSVALPQGLDEDARRISLMPFLILDWAIALEDPCQVDWLNIANDPKFAIPRIWTRNTFSSCILSREFNISPQSIDLGFFVLHMSLCIMESIVRGMTLVPEKAKDWDNTTCHMMRGMMCQLFATSASTKAVLCPVYKILHKSAILDILPIDQWWVLSRMLKMLPYTCWDRSTIIENVQRYIIKAIRKFVTNEPCQKMQKLITSFDKIQKVKSPEWLAFLRLIVDVSFYYGDKMLTHGTKIPPDVANRLLCFKSFDLSKGTSMILDLIRKLVIFLESVVNGNADWNEGFFKALQIAAFSYVKHSDNIVGSKDTIRSRVHLCQNLQDIVSTYQDIRGQNIIPKWASSDNPNHIENLNTILCSDNGDGESLFKEELQQLVTINMDLDLKVVPEVKTLPTILDAFPGSSDAVALAQSIPQLTVTSEALNKIPSIHSAALLDFVGVTDHDATVREIIHSLLLGWRDDPAKVESDTIDIVFKRHMLDDEKN